jgi:hypothetical protein
MLMGAVGVQTTSLAGQCEGGWTSKVDATSGTQAAINNLVLPQGTVFCVFAGTRNTGKITANGTTTLQQYLEAAGILNGSGTAGRNVGHYVLYPSPVVITFELAWANQPVSHELGEAIPGAVANSSPQVRLVEKHDGVEQTTTTATTTVSVSLAPSSATLEGASAGFETSSGIATLADLTVTPAELGYRLVATSPLTGGSETTYESTTFDVFDEKCPAGDCEFTAGSLEDDDFEITMSGVAESGGGGFIFHPGGEGEGTCTAPEGATVARIPSAFTITGTGFVPGEKYLTIKISKDYDKSDENGTRNNGAAFYQICMEPADPGTPYSVFIDRYSPSGTPTYVTGTLSDPEYLTVDLEEATTAVAGFLPDCEVSERAPCVVSRGKDDGNPVIVVKWGSRSFVR